MSLLETFLAKQRQKRQERETTRAALWTEYRAILERNDNPRRGDEDRLASIVNKLGIQPEHVELHLIVLREAQKYRAEIATCAKFQRKLVQAEAELRDRQADLERAHERIREAERNCRDLRQVVTRGEGFEESFSLLASHFPELLGECGALKDGPKGGAPPEPVLSHMRRLGLV